MALYKLVVHALFLQCCLATHALFGRNHSSGGGRNRKIDVWVPSFKNEAWTLFNIENMVDLARNPSSLDIRVLCMTPGEGECSRLSDLLTAAIPSVDLKVVDLSKVCNRWLPFNHTPF